MAFSVQLLSLPLSGHQVFLDGWMRIHVLQSRICRTSMRWREREDGPGPEPSIASEALAPGLFAIYTAGRDWRPPGAAIVVIVKINCFQLIDSLYNTFT